MTWAGIKDYGFGSKNRTKEQDDEYRSRIGGIPRQRIWTKEKCIQELEDLLNILKKILKDDEKTEVGDNKKLKNETVRDSITLINKIMDYMRYLYPPVQQNVNVNIDMTANAVIDRLKEWKKNKLEEGTYEIINPVNPVNPVNEVKEEKEEDA
jgi:hypothetical protein